MLRPRPRSLTDRCRPGGERRRGGSRGLAGRVDESLDVAAVGGAGGPGRPRRRSAHSLTRHSAHTETHARRCDSRPRCHDTHMRLVMRSYNTAPREARRLMLGGPEAERPAASPPCAVRALGFNPARPAGLATPAYREMIHCHARGRMLAHERPRRFDPEASIAAPGEANSRAASSADTRLETTLGDFSPLACAYGEQSAKRAVRADGSNGQGGIGEGSPPLRSGWCVRAASWLTGAGAGAGAGDLAGDLAGGVGDLAAGAGDLAARFGLLLEAAAGAAGAAAMGVGAAAAGVDLLTFLKMSMATRATTMTTVTIKGANGLRFVSATAISLPFETTDM